MTDITDQDRRAARAWAKNWQGDLDADTSAAARVILATVDAPAPTLAEAVEAWADKHYTGVVGTGKHELLALASRAEQMENDLAEASAEVGRLTAERDRLEAAQHLSDGSAWGGPVREPTVQKGAESNAENPDPADVKPGEPWLVEVNREKRTAVKDNDAGVPWNTVTTNGVFRAENDDDVTLVTRLVPAPRVITNPDGLNRAKRLTVIRDGVGVVCERAPLGDGWFTTGHGTDQTPYITFPVTVLWEPGA